MIFDNNNDNNNNNNNDDDNNDDDNNDDDEGLYPIQSSLLTPTFVYPFIFRK